MIEKFEQLKDWMHRSEAARVQDCLNWFPEYFRSVPFPDAYNLADLFKNHRDIFNRIFEGESSLCKSVGELQVQLSIAAKFRPNPDDSMLLGNSSVMLYLLVLGAERQKVPDWLIKEIVKSYESLFLTFLSTLSEQIDGILRFLLEIKASLARLALNNPRIILLDLPIGNTIPVLLMHDLLRSLGRTEINRVSLARNASHQDGLTRNALLVESLGESKVGPNDIVIYLDEWNTGSNFKAICDILKKAVPKDSFLLPLALLTEKAQSHPRFESFSRHHDKLMERWGHTFQRARILPPRMRTCLPIDTYLFWSENDRLAGFRKAQIHGAIFSSYDAAIEVLKSDGEKLKTTIAMQLAIIAKDETPQCDVGTSAGTLWEFFQQGYDDYQQCRERLRDCAAEFDRGGEVADFSPELSAVTKLQDEVIGDRPAKWAHLLADTYMKKLGSIDPADRYFFENHAPTLVRLTGLMALPHELTMQFLRQRMDQLQTIQSGPS